MFNQQENLIKTAGVFSIKQVTLLFDELTLFTSQKKTDQSANFYPYHEIYRKYIYFR
jgi:hypothetical protein